jgi:pimeloyl-ACP methyl ester carboxylesterase
MTMNRRTLLAGLTAAAAGLGGRSQDCQAADEILSNTPADDLAMPDPEESADTVPQPGLPTLGGRQFWGDVVFRTGFRIQRNVFSGHFRLLDAADRRYASGTEAECRTALEALVRTRQLPPDSGHAVILIHGIGRSSKSLNAVARSLADLPVFCVPFDYPSTRVSLADCADYLRQVIQSLTSAERISFVVHSMGGLVVRRMLQDLPDPRCHRLIMMGTPNHGAELAGMLKKFFLFRAIWGPAGQELAGGAGSALASLPTPAFPFGVIAGGRGDDEGYNQLLPGDDDGTVTVASTRLQGAADFLRIPRLHSFLMSDQTALEAVRCFLEHARFSLTRQPAPIT